MTDEKPEPVLLYDHHGVSFYVDDQAVADELLEMPRGSKDPVWGQRAPFTKEDPIAPEMRAAMQAQRRHAMMLKQLRRAPGDSRPPKIATEERLEEVCADYGMDPDRYRDLGVWNDETDAGEE